MYLYTTIIMLTPLLISATIAFAPTESPAVDLGKHSLMTSDIYTTLSFDSLSRKQALTTKYPQRYEIMQEIRIKQMLEEIENLSETIEDLLTATDAEEIDYLTNEEYLRLTTTDLELIDFTFNNKEIWETEEGLQNIERKITEVKNILAELSTGRDCEKYQ
jgi:hypothetical protein